MGSLFDRDMIERQEPYGIYNDEIQYLMKESKEEGCSTAAVMLAKKIGCTHYLQDMEKRSYILSRFDLTSKKGLFYNALNVIIDMHQTEDLPTIRESGEALRDMLERVDREEDFSLEDIEEFLEQLHPDHQEDIRKSLLSLYQGEYKQYFQQNPTKLVPYIFKKLKEERDSHFGKQAIEVLRKERVALEEGSPLLASMRTTLENYQKFMESQSE